MAKSLSYEERVASDVVICGAGVAGLCAALGLRPMSVSVLTKAGLTYGANSFWAQGGVAAAIGEGDSPGMHSADTKIAGAGLSDSTAVDMLTHEAADAIALLTRLGARWDRDHQGEIDLAREAAHRLPRVLHAKKDATGSELMRALSEGVNDASHVTVFENSFLCDLALDENGAVIGALSLQNGRRVLHQCRAVVIATGGLGYLYRYTTNPREACGDGLAAAARAGALLSDMEFVQFHPTALLAKADPLPLITEALRGAGAVLVDGAGKRFMCQVHQDAELAPRDVVARAVFSVMESGERAYLDATRALGHKLHERFPTIFQLCQDNGIDPRVEQIPIAPAAHYHMGGITVDLHGRASPDGLWACGEVACSGIHGANRLASNSLLEAIVFGNRVAEDIMGTDMPRTGGLARLGEPEAYEIRPDSTEEIELQREMRESMWRNVGLMRNETGLGEAREQFASMLRRPSTSLRHANRALVCWLIASSALVRKESRGAHYRTDYAETRARFQGHSLAQLRGHASELDVDVELARPVDELGSVVHNR